jgi:hypothetical protein
MLLQREVRGRVQFTNGDRLFFIQLYRWCPSVLKAMIILRPAHPVRAIQCRHVIAKDRRCREQGRD